MFITYSCEYNIWAVSIIKKQNIMISIPLCTVRVTDRPSGSSLYDVDLILKSCSQVSQKDWQQGWQMVWEAWQRYIQWPPQTPGSQSNWACKDELWCAIHCGLDSQLFTPHCQNFKHHCDFKRPLKMSFLQVQLVY